MRRFVLLLLAVILFGAVSSDAFGNKSETVVLVSLDVVQAMGEVLTRDTSIRIVNVISNEYSLGGQAAYFKKHQKVFFAKAIAADAVLSVGAAWPEDTLYKWARRGNIRVVNIDVCKPLDGYGAGVPLIRVGNGKYFPYVWQSPANLTRMASIAADDLSRLVPAEKEKIKENLRRLQTELFKLRSRYELAFSSLEQVNVAAFTYEHSYLVDEFGLDVQFYFMSFENLQSKMDEQELAKKLRNRDVRAVICAWEPDEKEKRAIAKGRAIPVLLERFVCVPEEDALDGLVHWYDGNLARLLEALQISPKIWINN